MFYPDRGLEPTRVGAGAVWTGGGDACVAQATYRLYPFPPSSTLPATHHSLSRNTTRTVQI
jgi:hypothetical protein